GGEDAGAQGACVVPLTEVADQCRQAAGSWEAPGDGATDAEPYRDALAGERAVRLELVAVAERIGDFNLAETQLDQLEARAAEVTRSELSSRMREGVERERGRVRSKATAARRSQRLLRTAAV